MNEITHIKLGTRTSPLALAQANMVKNSLERHHDNIRVEIILINTSGDIQQDKRLADIGGKGLFTKELDIALIDGRCDIAVHSLKDVETNLPEGTILGCFLPREDVRDVFISSEGIKLMNMPQGATIGTSSLRRQAQILKMRPDFNVILFRGNVATRLQKLQSGVADGTMLALAGLKRLRKNSVATEILDTDTFIPAVGQGAITVQCREKDTYIIDILQPLNCTKTKTEVCCERNMLEALDGTCKTPVGAYAFIEGDTIKIDAFASTDDGVHFEHIVQSDMVKNADILGKTVGKELRRRMGTDFDTMGIMHE